MDDLVKEFLAESREGLDQLDRDLLALAEGAAEPERLAGVFRTIHTIKGTCGFLGYQKLEDVAHAGESLLACLREGSLAMSDPIADALLQLVDAVRAMLASIEACGSDGEGDWAALRERLAGLRQAQAPATSATPAPSAAAGCDPAAVSAAATPAATPTACSSGPQACAPELEADAALGGAAETVQRAAESSVRVDVELLDQLMNLVGELVLARNQILSIGGRRDDARLNATTQRLNTVTTELQAGVMKTRMQPVSSVWNRFPRLVRDLSRACGKQARMELSGGDTELDRTIIEAIRDPLTHLLRNAIDHGLEPPERRRQAGKRAEGCLTLRACHESGQVNIEIQDDGGGIDLERVRAKALERGLVTAAQAPRLSQRELLNLILLPGFSTAQTVTSVSGRGVGLDVVRTNVERIGGTLEIESSAGRGTLVKIKIPLTLAIIPALIVTTGGDRYAIPQVNLLELLRLEAGDARRLVEDLHGTPVCRLRDELLPLVDLGAHLSVGPALAAGAVSIVVVQADGQRFALAVDEIDDTEEIVVKPIDRRLKGLGTWAGATILGDGRVALILDVIGLAQRARVLSQLRSNAGPSQPVSAGSCARRSSLLLLELPGGSRAAVPLSAVARLEEIDEGAIERSGGRPVVQYHGAVLPLVDLGTLTGGPAAQARTGRRPLVVTSDGEHALGLLVERVIDIVEVDDRTGEPGQGALRGSAILAGKVTDLLDLRALLRGAAAGPARPPGGLGAEARHADA